ncbi:hypothetical protein JHK87_024911 [Glycine soja]|nr:hypothetical protein JHK87_024911 [Glycine soja]
MDDVMSREFKSGDKVDVALDRRWREGHVSVDLGDGTFVVSFGDSKEEMVFPKELLRVRYESINHSWVPSNRIDQ